MSTRSSESSSQTWSGEERAPANIIDLDKFIHNAVRASSTRRREPAADPRRYCPRVLHPAQGTASACDSKFCAELSGLVVDAGGVERKVPAAGGKQGPAGGAGGGGALPGAGLTRRAHDHSRSSASTPPHDKRFSHDSGLSDGSVRHKKQRMLRRGVSEVSRRTPTRRAVRSGVSASSLRVFRALCERALCDQQTLIVRVAELCERLTERPGPGACGGGAGPAGGAGQPAAPPPRPRAAPPTFSPRSSEDSTTTHTSASKYAGRVDKQRTGEFNTYKLIMTKLDAMSRMMAVRPPRPPRLHRAASSGSVTVSDKIVATEPAPLQVARSRRGTSKYSPPNTHTNVTVHRAILGKREHGAYGHPARYNHDDDEHITHIYSKAARLHTLPAMKRRALSVGAHLEQCAEHERDGYKREVSLCALCRFYWRTFRQ